VSGSLVACLNANGQGEATWQPHVPAGVYYVTVEHDGAVNTEKVVFVQ
jgi:hypothetical protein